jgi:hypothetical protein
MGMARHMSGNQECCEISICDLRAGEYFGVLWNYFCNQILELIAWLLFGGRADRLKS